MRFVYAQGVSATPVSTSRLALQYNLAINQGNHECAFAFTYVDLALSTS